MKLLPLITAAAVLTLTGVTAAHAQDHQPMANDHAAHNPATKSPDRMTGVPLAKGKSSFTAGQAKARFQKAGYSHVSNLMRDNDGLWRARVQRHGKWVNAALDYKGNVSTR